MKKTVLTIAILLVVLRGVELQAAKGWEGTDGFTSSARWYEWQKKGKNGEQGRLSLKNGELIYASSAPWWKGLGSGVWLWGTPQKPLSIPTSACWEIECDVAFPENAPMANTDVAVSGICIVWYSGNSPVFPGIYCGIWASYDNPSKTIGETLQVATDFNFRQGMNNDKAPVVLQTISTGSRKIWLRFAHDALTQRDSLQVKDKQSGEILYIRTESSSLASNQFCRLGPFMMVGEDQSWPGISSNMAADNWSVVENNPDPINLNVQSSSSKGVAYSVAVAGLDLVNQKLTGTVALTVGSVSATMPIAGSIDKNGYFALTAKGTGANKGFGCVLLYNAATGTYRPSKNTVTAPKQKPIKF